MMASLEIRPFECAGVKPSRCRVELLQLQAPEASAHKPNIPACYRSRATGGLCDSAPLCQRPSRVEVVMVETGPVTPGYSASGCGLHHSSSPKAPVAPLSQPILASVAPLRLRARWRADHKASCLPLPAR